MNLNKVKIWAVFIIICVLLMGTARFNISAETSGFDYDNYFEVDWLQSDGVAYIDTGIQPDRNTITESKWEGGTSGMFFGVNSSGGQTGFYQFYINSGKYVARFVTSNVITPTQSSLFTDPFTVVTNPRSEFTLTDGTTTFSKSASISSSAGATRNLYLFTNNSQGSLGNFTTAKLYYFYVKDYSTNSYTHKFIPAVRKSDQKVGLYDTITTTFYYSNSGSFTYGGSVATRYTISTSVSPSGSGSVIGGGEYDSGSIVSLQAVANTGYEFSSWSDGITDNPRSVVVNSSQSFTAQFIQQSAPVTRYTISTSVSPSGSGTVSGGGTYDQGTQITLTAVPNSGYVFGSWSDGSTANPRNLTVTSNLSLTAYFSQDVSHQIVLGTYLNIIGRSTDSYPNYYVYSGSSSDGYSYYFSVDSDNIGGTVSTVYEVVVVLNDDYIGSCNVIVRNTSGSGQAYPFNQTVYVNGNIFYCRFPAGQYINSSNITVSISTDNLIKKLSTETLLQEGTPDSNQSANNLNDQNEELSGAVSQISELESSYSDDLNSNLESLDISGSGLSAFGSNFLASAQWVTHQYNRLTGNTPFGSLIGFSLALGVALLIIGKAAK